MKNLLISILFGWMTILSASSKEMNNDAYEHYNFFPLTIKDGLLHNCINSVYKDSQGFIWLSTQNGLSRYDGYEFSNYNTLSSKLQLKHNFVNRVVEDVFHRLWIATEGGLEVLELHTNKLLNLTENSAIQATDLSYSPINFMLLDKNGRLILATQMNLYIISFDKKGAIESCTSLYSNYDKYVEPITALSIVFDEIWVGYGRDIYKVVEHSERNSISIEKAIDCRAFGVQNRVHCMCQLGSDVWIGTNNGLYKYNTQLQTYKRYGLISNDNQVLSQSSVTDIALTDRNQLLVSILRGVNFYDPQKDCFSHLAQPNSEDALHCNLINDIYVDNNLIWIGTEISGLIKVTPQKLLFESYPISTYFPVLPPISAIFEDDNENLWVGSVNGDLLVKQKDGVAFLPFKSKLAEINESANNDVCSILQDNKQRIWVATKGEGIHLFSINSNAYPVYLKHYNAGNSLLKSNFVTSLCLDKLNEGIWIGTVDGLVFHDLKTDTFQSVSLPTDRYSGNELVGMLIDEKMRLWIGTKHGLLIADLYSFAKRRKAIKYKYLPYKLDDTKSREIEKINCIYQDSKKNIWITSNGHGLYKLKSDVKDDFVFENILIAESLPDHAILGILEDNHNELWLTSNYGLIRYNPMSHTSHVYFEKDGILSDQFYANASCKSKTGVLYFASLKGIDGVKAVRDEVLSRPDSVLLTRFFVQDEEIVQGGNTYLDKSISWSKQIRLHERNKSFSIEFAALNYENTPSIRYAYRLDGFDSRWLYGDAKRHFANYTNLRSGTYTFQVKAIGIDGKEDTPITEITIIVAPFYYKTWWFFLLVMFGIMLIAFYFYQWKVASLKKQREELKQKVKEHTADLENKMVVLSKQNVLLIEQKQQLIDLSQKIQEATADRIAFFTNITHEFRTPITLIVGPIERALKLSTNPDVRELLFIMERSSRSLLSLVNQLLDFRKVDSGNLVIRKKSGNMLHLLDEILLPFKAFANDRRINIETFIRIDNPYFIYDAENLRKVLVNLLSNAMKFTPAGGIVKIYFSVVGQVENKSQLYICVSDTGEGVLMEDLEKIFGRFYQSSTNTQFSIFGQSGTGIGLYLCKRIVEEHGGTIYATNQKRKGCSFRVLLPLQQDNDFFKKEDVGVDILNQESLPNIDEKHLAKQYTMLIVEDNIDMAVYLSSIFRSYYKLLAAENGQMALELLESLKIDFILSDVMMPVMDGIQLSKKVKEDIRISHIPILLLTAKDSPETRIESFKIGVDEYFQKPFDERLLLARVENIMNRRTKMLEKFQLKMDPNVLQIEEESKDKKILNDIMRIIEGNYTNADFDVRIFADKMGVSKTLLNQKMQDLIGLSTGKFIGKYRLNKAWEMVQVNMKTHNLNVSEIAYRTGFNDPKYFARCFQKEYGVLPSVLLDSEGNKNT